jgi:hypothetical protein
MIWLRVADVRGELLKRGVSVSKWANPWKLMKLLDKKLEEEVEKVSTETPLHEAIRVLRLSDGSGSDMFTESLQVLRRLRRLP